MTISSSAKAEIQARVDTASSYPAVPALLLSYKRDTKETTWHIALYDRRVVEGKDFEGLMLRVSGVELVLPQQNLLDSLNPMHLDWDGEQFSLRQRQR